MLQGIIDYNDRQNIARYICNIANVYVLDVTDSFAWERLSKIGSFTKEDFFDDKDETIKLYGEEAVSIYGIKNWKLKDGVMGDEKHV